jgi:hypothetical protein
LTPPSRRGARKGERLQAMLAIAEWLLAQFPNLLMTVEEMIEEGIP